MNGRSVIKDVLLNNAGVFDIRPDFYSGLVCKGRLAFDDYSQKWILLKKIVVNKLHTFVNDK